MENLERGNCLIQTRLSYCGCWGGNVLLIIYTCLFPVYHKTLPFIPILTLKDPFISESYTEMKIELNFYFYKALKAFIKPFDAPQRSVKIKM